MKENVSKLSTFSHSRENVCRLGQSLPYSMFTLQIALEKMDLQGIGSIQIDFKRRLYYDY